MERLHPELRRDHDRWAEKLGGEEQGGLGGVGALRVLLAHYLLVDYFLDGGDAIGIVGPRSLNLLHSAVSRQYVSLGETEKWPDPIEKAATLFFGLVKNHAFHDGNKRTALLVALDQLMGMGRALSASQEDFEILTVRTAASELDRYEEFGQCSGLDPEVTFIARQFSRYTRVEDNRDRRVTFRQFKSILKGFGFDLQNPSGNYIDVVRLEDGQRIARTGFPGWTRQVGAADLRSVRKKTCLTSSDGVDSAVFFSGADSLEVLIDEFREPLLRLADS